MMNLNANGNLTGETNYSHHFAKLLQIEDESLNLSILHQWFIKKIEYKVIANFTPPSTIGWGNKWKELIFKCDHTSYIKKFEIFHWSL